MMPTLKKMKKIEFCKLLLMADYVILIAAFVVFIGLTVRGEETSNCAIVISAWIAQLGISSGFYYWKAKAENLVKLPIYMLSQLPEDMKEKADPNRVIEAAITIKD